MALTILNAVERRLYHKDASGKALSDKMWLPWDSDYQVVSAVERPTIIEYLRLKTMTEPRPPFVNVPGMLNFRDVGGYDAGHGHSVRRGLVFRSADFNGLNATGIQQLQSLGIKIVFDLRSSYEVEKLRTTGGDKEFEAWSALPDGPNRCHVPVFADSDYSPDVIAKRFKDYMGEGVKVNQMDNCYYVVLTSSKGFERAYRAILLNSQTALRTILSHLANCSSTPLPMIIHCSAGKDRTGVIVMILLLLAGCSKDLIAKEYQLTEVGLGPEWKAKTVKRLQENPIFHGENVEGIERMVGARHEVMEAVVDMVDTEFGGVEEFLTGPMGINKKTLQICKLVLREEGSAGF